MTASAPDFIQANRKIHQIANKPGSVGQAVPGVALRLVDDQGQILGASSEGKIEVLRAGQNGWQDSGQRGRMESDGFIWLEDPSAGHTTEERLEIVRIPDSKQTQKPAS